VPNWSDNFAGPAGAPVDPTSWSSVTNGEGGGNQEMEYYTPESNALSGNGLVITAARDNGRYGAWYGPSQYTSGKLWTQGKVNFLYGRIQATMTLPDAGKPGSWPAFWMLGSDYPNVGWPACGEIDIMESFGSLDDPTQISASIHTPSTNLTQVYKFPQGQNALTSHTYAVDWRPSSLSFSVDGNVFFTVSKSQVPEWPFDKPSFLILNYALGGAAGGSVPATAELPYTMDVQSVEAFNSIISNGG
jgi:beta-glucanase (GH16 family)